MSLSPVFLLLCFPFFQRFHGNINVVKRKKKNKTTKNLNIKWTGGLFFLY